ncbi:MAG: PP2C family protein-serine/threonine phosphatase [Acidimicrobiales bacterium]
MDAVPTPPPAPEGNGILRAHGVLAKLAWALRSDPGCLRPHNEDFAGIHAPTTPDDAWDRGPLFALADGLGGHAAGEVASRLAVEATLASWREGQPAAPHQALRAAARQANVAVYDAALEAGRQGMGTTLTALTLAGREAIVVHAGDSRAYLVRGEQCLQLTADHSRVGEMLRMKLITPEQAATHPARSMLTRSLGGELAVQVDLVRQPIQRYDTFVLCSDGLWDVVSSAELAAIAGAIDSERIPTPAECAERLVDLALERDAADNVTVVVVRVSSDRPIPAAGARRSLFRRGRG